MKLIDKKTGKEVDMAQEDLFVQNNKIYEVWGSRLPCIGFDKKDVTDQYEILTGVRSRSEIEERIEYLKKSAKNTLDDETRELMQARYGGMEWCLKGEDEHDD